MKIGPNNFLGINWEPMIGDSTEYQLWYGDGQNPSSRTVKDLDQQINSYLYSGRSKNTFRGPLAHLQQMAAARRRSDQRKAMRDLTAQLMHGLPSFSPAVRELGNTIRNQFPEEKGWRIETQKTVTDFTRYASIIPVVAINDRTNERHIIDIDSTGTQRPMFTKARLSAQRRMLEMTSPGQHVTGTWSASIDSNTKSSSLVKMTPMDDNGLNKALYGMPFSRGFRNLDKEEQAKMSQLDMSIMQKFPIHKGPYARSFTYLDTETGFGQEVLSVGAMNIALDKSGKILGRLDNGFFRYYPSRNEKSAGFRLAAEVNKLSNKVIKGYREQQNARYSKYWNKKELAELNKYIDGQVVFGHNIDAFDREVLRVGNMRPTAKGWFDIYTFMQNNNLSLSDKRDLEAWYKLSVGKSMEQGGWSHHQVQFDVGAGIESTARLLADKGRLGKQARFVVDNNQPVSLAGIDSTLNSWVVNTQTGEYIDMRNIKDDDTYSLSIGDSAHSPRGKSKKIWFDADGTIFDTYDKSQQYPEGGAYAAFDAGNTEPFVRTASQINPEVLKQIIEAKISGNFGGVLTTALSAKLRDGSTIPGHTDESLYKLTKKAKKEQFKQLNRALIQYTGKHYPHINNLDQIRVSPNEWHVLKAGTDKFGYAKRYQGATPGDILVDDSSREGAAWEKGSGAGTWNQVSFGAGANAAYGGKAAPAPSNPAPTPIPPPPGSPASQPTVPEITQVDEDGVSQIADGFSIEDAGDMQSSIQQQSDMKILMDSLGDLFNHTLGDTRKVAGSIQETYQKIEATQSLSNRMKTIGLVSKTLGADDQLARELLGKELRRSPDDPYINDLMKLRSTMAKVESSRKTDVAGQLDRLRHNIGRSEYLSEDEKYSLKTGLWEVHDKFDLWDAQDKFADSVKAAKGRQKDAEREEAEQQKTYNRTALNITKLNDIKRDIDRSSLSPRTKRSLGFLYENEKEEAEFTSSVKNLSDAFKNATQEADTLSKALGNMLSPISNAKWYDGQQLASTAQSNVSRWEKASSGFVPRFLQRPLHFLNGAFKDGFQNWWDQKYALPQKTMNVLQPALSTTATIVGTAVAGPVGGAVANAAANLPAAITQVVGTIAQNKMQVFGNQVSQALNLLSAGVQFALVPLKLFGVMLGIGAVSFKKFMNSLSGYGMPLTGLSGVTYPRYEGHRAMDTLAGLKPGSLNALTEDFGMQSSSLFTMGKYNQDRLIASALLGIFDTTYNTDMSGEEMLRANANKLTAQFNTADRKTRQDMMTWMKQVDPSGALAQTVQTMHNLGITDYDTYMNPNNRDIYFRNITQEERNKFQWTNYEWQNSLRQLDFTKSRIATHIWDSFGKTTMNGVNRSLDYFSQGDYAKGINGLLDTFQSLWNNMTNIISQSDLPRQLGESLKTIGQHIVKWLSEIDWSPIGAKIGGIFDIAIDKIADLIEFLGTISIDPFDLDQPIKAGIRSFNEKGAEKSVLGGITSVELRGGTGRMPEDQRKYIQKQLSSLWTDEDITYLNKVANTRDILRGAGLDPDMAILGFIQNYGMREWEDTLPNTVGFIESQKKGNGTSINMARRAAGSSTRTGDALSTQLIETTKALVNNSIDTWNVGKQVLNKSPVRSELDIILKDEEGKEKARIKAEQEDGIPVNFNTYGNGTFTTSGILMQIQNQGGN